MKLDKINIVLIAAVVVLGIICITLAGGAKVAKTQQGEMVTLTAKVQDLEAKLTESDRKASTVNNIQNSLNAARKEIATIQEKARALSSENSDLKARLEAAMGALNTPSATLVP